MSDYAIIDDTDTALITGDGPTLAEAFGSIEKDLTRRIELLARSVAYSGGAATEQGILHTSYANGAIHREGERIRDCRASGLDAKAQIAALQIAAQETYETVLANKPTDADLLIWRSPPQALRSLREDGLYVRIKTRLSWDKVRED